MVVFLLTFIIGVLGTTLIINYRRKTFYVIYRSLDPIMAHPNDTLKQPIFYSLSRRRINKALRKFEEDYQDDYSITFSVGELKFNE